MKNTKNTVAQIFKIYAIVNFVACLFMTSRIEDYFYYAATEISMVWIAVSIVVNVVIYAVGEVIQLLDDIKQNTAKGGSSVDEIAARAADELPEL